MKRYIEKHFNCSIDLDNEGEAYLFGSDAAKVDEACSLVKDLVVDIRVGDTFFAEVSEIKDFGALVRIARCQEALLHYSEISHDKDLLKRPVEEMLRVGQRIQVKVLAVDVATGQVKVSRKALLDESSLPDNIELSVSNSKKTDLPEFPVHPPRKWNREFFRKHVVSAKETNQSMKVELETTEQSSVPKGTKPWSRRSKKSSSATGAATGASIDDEEETTTSAKEADWDISTVQPIDHSSRLRDLDDYELPTDVSWEDAVNRKKKANNLDAAGTPVKEGARCWDCGQEGHIAAECPEKSKPNADGIRRNTKTERPRKNAGKKPRSRRKEIRDETKISSEDDENSSSKVGMKEKVSSQT